MEIVALVKLPAKFISQQLPEGRFSRARNPEENHNHSASVPRDDDGHNFVSQILRNFAGVRDISAVHSLMTKWAFLAVAGFLGCSLSISAQTTDLLAFSQPGQSVVNSRAISLSTLNGARYGYPTLTLLDSRFLSLANGYAWIEPQPHSLPLPAESAKTSTKISTTLPPVGDSDKNVVTEHHNLFDYVHGEVTLFYGRSVGGGGGRFSRDLEGGSVFTEMGNDRTQVSVGAYYEQLSGHIPRR